MKKKIQKEKDDHWGVRLKKILTEKNIPLREVARMCSTSPSVVSGWINNGNSPTDLMAIKNLADELGVSFSWLLTGTYEKGVESPSLTEIFEEQNWFDGYARIRIDKLIPKKK